VSAPTFSDSGWVDAAAVARHLGVDRSYVYEHSTELGAVRLGDGPRARLRFNLAVVDEPLAATACPGARESEAANPVAKRHRRHRMGTDASAVPELLPIRGRRIGT
jgi:hypothetical protein